MITILPEHEHLSNQELINIYGPEITNTRKRNKVARAFFIHPSLTKDGANWHETVEVEKKMGIYDGRKIPRSFLYKLPSNKVKKKARKELEKQEKYSKIKFSAKSIVCSKKVRKERLKCLNLVQPVETKKQIS